MNQDPTEALLDALCGFVARCVPGHAPRRLILVLDDGQRIVLPVGPWFAEWARRREGKDQLGKDAGPARS